MSGYSRHDGNKKVNRENDEIRRHDAQYAPREKPAKTNFIAACEGREQLPADQVTTEDEEKIDTDPAKTIDSAGKFESEKRSVINNDHDNGERAEKIETRLAFAAGKARVNSEREWHYGFRVGNAARSTGHQ